MSVNDLLEKYPKRLPIDQAAKLLDKSQMFVRCGLRASRFPFGTAVLMDGGNWSYYINTMAFIRYLNGHLFDTQSIAEQAAVEAIDVFKEMEVTHEHKSAIGKSIQGF